MSKQPIILIVDDIPKNIQLVAQHLKSLGCKLLFATSGKKALSLLKEGPVDLILLDIMMPEMDGFETCRLIKEEQDYAKIPVIFLTAKNDVADIVEGFDAGGADYIIKPFHGQELIERVKTHLDLKIHRDQLHKNQQQLQELVHILSHDLRNSLSGISMTLDLADLENDSLDKYEERIREMSRNGLNIIELVRTMLSLDDKPVVLSPVNLQDCLNQSLEILKPQLYLKKISPLVHFDEKYMVMGESTSLINSVLNNILTNAIKFSNKSDTINISVKRKNRMIELVFRDYGIGIPENIQENLFNIHKAVSRKGTDGEKGTGYGLSLVKKFMIAYGGSISIKSSLVNSPDFPRGTLITLLFQEAL